MDRFEDLYCEHRRDVFRFLFRLTDHNADLAEELTQDTFYHAYLAISRFRGECTVKSWLFGIAKKRFFLYLRKNKKSVIGVSDLLFELTDDSSFDFFDHLYEKKLLCDALSLIFDFEEPMKSVFLLRIYCETPYKQLGEQLSISESAAKVLFHRGKRLLQTKLKEVYGYEIHLPFDR